MRAEQEEGKILRRRAFVTSTQPRISLSLSVASRTGSRLGTSMRTVRGKSRSPFFFFLAAGASVHWMLNEPGTSFTVPRSFLSPCTQPAHAAQTMRRRERSGEDEWGWADRGVEPEEDTAVARAASLGPEHEPPLVPLLDMVAPLPEVCAGRRAVSSQLRAGEAEREGLVRERDKGPGGRDGGAQPSRAGGSASKFGTGSSSFGIAARRCDALSPRRSSQIDAGSGALELARAAAAGGGRRVCDVDGVGRALGGGAAVLELCGTASTPLRL
eukprot:COSAG04_NODE_541_length_12866_cov_847.972351_10_plen_271_part_00